ncbi:ubiquitin-like domain-containing protein [Streptomyces gobiensis]|nr:resuscitation-promoting factor [Streptomyces gobiensis]UGY95083.1 ubiquitin-like domain-containing protein [Streptomyces gobiensis]
MHEAYKLYEAPYERDPYDTYQPSYEPRLPRQPSRASTAALGLTPTPPAPVPTPAPVPAPAPGGRAAARRAAHAKRAADRPELLRKLLPQALVVAFLAGGTTAFVAQDKAVKLTVDGKPTTLRTFANSVADLLEDEGVEVGRHDAVAPAAHERLAHGDRVAVRYGRPLILTLDGRRQRVWTTERTVEAALRQLGVRAQGAYLSVPRSRPIGRAGLELVVRTERSVTFLADGREHTVRTNAATVREAMAQAGVRLRNQDTTSTQLDAFPRDGEVISVRRITANKKIREEQIPFTTERHQNPHLFQGTEVVERPGSHGIRRVTYELRTVDGVRQKPRQLEARMVRRPEAQIIKVGTKSPPESVSGADHLNWDALARCESGGRTNHVDDSGTYGGLYQFDTHTWQALGGKGRPQDAPAAEQTYRAKKLYVQRGASPWPVCGRKLHQ